jgi:hypothetical protein
MGSKAFALAPVRFDVPVQRDDLGLDANPFVEFATANAAHPGRPRECLEALGEIFSWKKIAWGRAAIAHRGPSDVAVVEGPISYRPNAPGSLGHHPRPVQGEAIRFEILLRRTLCEAVGQRHHWLRRAIFGLRQTVRTPASREVQS